MIYMYPKLGLFFNCVLIALLFDACQYSNSAAIEAARKDSLLHCTTNLPERYGNISANKNADSNVQIENKTANHEGMVMIPKFK